jgi:hypothetical protein
MQPVIARVQDASADSERTARAVIVQGAIFNEALMLDGPDAGRRWVLEGKWCLGQELQVRYCLTDQFARVGGS